MTKLITILLIVSCLTGSAQVTSMTIQPGPRNFTLISSNKYGQQIGYFRFDSLSGKFTQTGNRVGLFRLYMASQNEVRKRLELAEKVLQWIDSTGYIRYPIEFKTDLTNWYKTNQ